MSFSCHLLHAFLTDKVKKTAMTLEDLTKLIASEDQPALPRDPEALATSLEILVDKGLILFHRNSTCLLSSCIVINQQALLEEVNGKLFAPETFKEHRQIASNTGIVPASLLHETFPDYDTELLVVLLTVLEFCHELDPALLETIYTNLSTGFTAGEQLLFFPALVSAGRPCMLVIAKGFGWAVFCTNPHQILTTRLLQVILLRLAFKFCLSKRSLPKLDLPRTRKVHSLSRKCTVWKNGIYWKTEDGIEAVVEVSEQHRRVSLIVSCDKSNCTEHIKLRSSLIAEILAIFQEFCPSVDLEEYLIPPWKVMELLDHDLAEMSIFSIHDMARCILLQKRFVSSVDEKKETNPGFLLFSDPYLLLPPTMVQQLFDSDRYSQPVSEIILRELHKHCEAIPSMFFSSISTHHSLQDKLNKLSVFAGRNPLDVGGVTAADLPPPYTATDTLPEEPLEKERQVQDLRQQLTRANRVKVQLELYLKQTEDELQIVKERLRAKDFELDQLKSRVKANEAHGVQQKAGIAAERILQKRIVTVIEVLKTHLNKFSNTLKEESLVAAGVFGSDYKIMKSTELASVLYSACMTAVKIDSSKFSVILDILREYPLLEQTVWEMEKEGVEAGLLKAKLSAISSTQGSIVPSQNVEDTSEDHTEKSTFGKTSHTVPSPPSATRGKLVQSETVDVGTQVDFLTIAEGSLQEVTVAGENSFIFQDSTPQDLTWEQYGFLAHICTNAFYSDQVHQVLIKVLVAGKFKFPPGSVLVSAVYAVVLSDKLQHPIEVKLQHCVDIQTPEQARCLRFVRANCTRPLPYTFKALDNGTFNVGSVYGSILCQKFSLLAVVYEYDPNASPVTILPPLSRESLHSFSSLLPPTTSAQQPLEAAISKIRCIATVYYSVQAGSKGTTNITFVVSKDVSALKQYARKELKGTTEGAELTFSFKEERVTLDLEEKKEVDGWLILVHQYPCEIQWKDVKEFGGSEDRLPKIKVDANPQDRTSHCLHHKVILKGTVEDKLSFFILCHISNTPDVIPSTEAILTEQDHYNEVKAKLPHFTEWKKLGERLGHYPGTLDVIESQCVSKGVGECLSQVIRQWLKRNHNEAKYGPPTWSSLAEALKTIDNALAMKIQPNIPGPV